MIPLFDVFSFPFVSVPILKGLGLTRSWFTMSFMGVYVGRLRFFLECGLPPSSGGSPLFLVLFPGWTQLTGRFPFGTTTGVVFGGVFFLRPTRDSPRHSEVFRLRSPWLGGDGGVLGLSLSFSVHPP